MGSGKSTIGRLLSNELKVSFIDTDKVIEERAGANIPWIFDVEGEDGFRNREEAIVDELTQEDELVLATGGGVVIREANRNALRNRGFVVYLQTSVEQQLERTMRDKNRPLLQTDNPRERLETLLKTREPLYKQTADMIMKTDRRHPRAVVSQLVKNLKKHNVIDESVSE